MNLKNTGLPFLFLFFQIVYSEEEVFKPSARVIYIKTRPDGPIINYKDLIVSNTTSRISDEFLSSKVENEDNILIENDFDSNINNHSNEVLSFAVNDEKVDGDKAVSSLNLTYDEIFSSELTERKKSSLVVDGRDGRSIGDFPYEYWKPLSKVGIEYDSKISDSQEKKNYAFYYGEPVNSKHEFDPSTWTVHPIKLPVDVIGEVNEKTTKNPLKEQTNYPSSIIPQYGRHPGATEPPPLYFPNSLSSKRSLKQPHIFRDRVGMESFPSNLNYKAPSVGPFEALKQFRRPQTGKRNEIPDNEAVPSNKIEIISTDRNADPPPHFFYPISDSTDLKVGILRKNKTHSYYTTQFKDDNNLISTLHAKTRQIFKQPSGTKQMHSGHKRYNSGYDILDYSRYDMQKRANPKIARKKYNENLIDIIKDKFIKNQNNVIEGDSQIRIRVPYKANTIAQGSSENHGKNSFNSTNLVKYYPNHNDKHHHKNQNMRPQYPRHRSRIANPLQFESHKDLTVNHDHSHDLRQSSPLPPKKKSEQIYFKRPSPIKHHSQDNNFAVNPMQNFQQSQQRIEHEGKISDNYLINGQNQKHLSQSKFNHFDRSKSDISTYANPAPRPVIAKNKGTTTNYLEQPKPSWLKSYIKDKQDSFSNHYYQKPSKPENFLKYKSQKVQQDLYRPPRPVSKEIMQQSYLAQQDPSLEVRYDNSLRAKLSRLWNAGFHRKPKPAPNAYPQFGQSSHSSKKDSKNLLYYYFDSNEEEGFTKPEEKTFLERIASIQNAPAAIVIPGGLAAFGLGLAYYYFNYIWYPTPIVTARLSDLLITYADNNIFNEKQKHEIEKVVDVFSGLESQYFTNAINSASCRNRLVCQLHQDIPSLWEVTQIISPVVSSDLEEQSSDEIRALKNYMSVAKQGVEATNSCRELFKSCNIPYLPLKPLLNSIFKGSSKTDNEYGESRVL